MHHPTDKLGENEEEAKDVGEEVVRLIRSLMGVSTLSSPPYARRQFLDWAVMILLRPVGV